MEPHSTQVVKARRAEVSASATRRVILDAARQLFLEHGYHGTTVQAVAREAGVAVQTIYNSIGSKPKLLHRVFFEAVAGDDTSPPPHVVLREEAERCDSPAEIIHLLVDFWRTALPRAAPIFAVIDDAAATDTDIRTLRRRNEDDRLGNYEHPMMLIDRLGGLPPNLTIQEAAAQVYAIGHHDMYRKLVLERGWTEDDWATWAERSLLTLLVEPQDRPRRPTTKRTSA